MGICGSIIFVVLKFGATFGGSDFVVITRMPALAKLIDESSVMSGKIQHLFYLAEKFISTFSRCVCVCVCCFVLFCFVLFFVRRPFLILCVFWSFLVCKLVCAVLFQISNYVS